MSISCERSNFAAVKMREKNKNRETKYISDKKKWNGQNTLENAVTK